MNNPNIVKSSFDLALFQSKLTTKILGRSCLHFERVESTMTTAKSLLDQRPSCGLVLVADEQTQGVGRGGRTWVSLPQGNLYFSLVVRCKNVLEDAFKMNFALAISVLHACREEGVAAEAVKLKWPNDVHIKGRKVCGILMDNGTDWMIAGVGVNVNQDMSGSEVKDVATSISEVVGHPCSREAVLANTLNCLEGLLDRTFADVLARYQTVELLTGSEVVVRPKGLDCADEEYVATAVGYDKSMGRLIVRKADGSIAILAGEDVKIRKKE
mmetsp:Transcript_15367/g.39190  ORF Transcript_15367/g.39190 Transcript_15367/m.39190 type:complete len:270 (-) Transcript_15367:270-1079(-)|eukprot:CAMPEP_0177645900 /NCGR_PEP_ID=MMETSP0447-20121125/9491_1 /TAXON_ID=0 /ORGANISM="Stygamoeba regulata, Strain BSH-02190019" /LENGTH=269 /DNA_ID=CAMNT_0019148405 /DNA_START=128 /DNA_END=937 /DNA_ORIENTATION=-